MAITVWKYAVVFRLLCKCLLWFLSQYSLKCIPLDFSRFAVVYFGNNRLSDCQDTTAEDSSTDMDDAQKQSDN